MSPIVRDANLIATGEALFGPLWQSAIARDLGVSNRTIRRWVAGTSPLPDGLTAELLHLVRARKRTLAQLIYTLEGVGWAADC